MTTSLARCGFVVPDSCWSVSAFGAPALAQGLGGAGTVQGTVKDPTGGVMQAVDGRASAIRCRGFTRRATTDAAGRFVFRNLPPNPYHITVDAQGFQTARARRRRASAVPIDARPHARRWRRDDDVEVVGHAEDLLERDPTAHTDIDQSLMAKLPLESSSRAQSGDHAGVAGRRRGLERLLPSRSAITRRRSSRSTTSRSPISRAASTRIRFRRTPCSRWKSSPAWRRPSTATRAASSSTSSPSPGSIRPKPTGQRVARLRLVQEPDVRGQHRRRLAHDRQLPVGVSGLRTDRFLDPPELQALHDTGNSLSLFDRLDFHPNDRDTLHLNLQAARSSLRHPEHLRPDRRPGAASEHRHLQRRAGLFARDRLEDAVHRQRLRPAGSRDLPAEREPVRRHAGHRSARIAR